MLEVWLAIRDMTASRHAAFQQRFSAHNHSAGAVQTLPLMVLTSDSSPYDIGTVLFHSVKDNCIASISLGPPHLSGRLKLWMCFLQSGYSCLCLWLALLGKLKSTHPAAKYSRWQCNVGTIMYYLGTFVENIDMLLLGNTYCQNWSTLLKQLRGTLVNHRQLKPWTASHLTCNINYKGLHLIGILMAWSVHPLWRALHLMRRRQEKPCLYSHVLPI